MSALAVSGGIIEWVRLNRRLKGKIEQSIRNNWHRVCDHEL